MISHLESRDPIINPMGKGVSSGALDICDFMERLGFHDSDFGLGVVDSVGVSCELEVFGNDVAKLGL